DGFARGFVRTVAIALGLPPDETLARMRPEAAWDDDRGTSGALVRALRAGALAALLGAALASSWMWLAGGAARARAPTVRGRADGLGVRRDAVRALAGGHGLLAPGAADAGTLAPLAPPADGPAGDAPPAEPAAPAPARGR